MQKHVGGQLVLTAMPMKQQTEKYFKDKSAFEFADMSESMIGFWLKLFLGKNSCFNLKSGNIEEFTLAVAFYNNNHNNSNNGFLFEDAFHGTQGHV